MLSEVVPSNHGNLASLEVDLVADITPSRRFCVNLLVDLLEILEEETEAVALVAEADMVEASEAAQDEGVETTDILQEGDLMTEMGTEVDTVVVTVEEIVEIEEIGVTAGTAETDDQTTGIGGITGADLAVAAVVADMTIDATETETETGTEEETEVDATIVTAALAEDISTIEIIYTASMLLTNEFSTFISFHVIRPIFSL